ncbi:MAG: hypothetical protein Q4A32_08245 [Lachnospiraceae bacterium]|nr:hypothetical protein [Lachnospiraceae bacterium]
MNKTSYENGLHRVQMRRRMGKGLMNKTSCENGLHRAQMRRRMGRGQNE